MLSLRPRRQMGEGSPQYLARIAHANGYSSATSFANNLGFNFLDIANGEDISWACFQTACADSILDDTAIIKGRHVSAFGQSIKRKHWSVQDSPMICPECWREDLELDRSALSLPRNWHRTIWDIRPLTVCGLHNRMLVDRCDCEAPFNRNAYLSNKCDCGQILSELQTCKLEKHEMTGDRYILNRFSDSYNEFDPFQSVKLGDAISAMQIIGALSCSSTNTSEAMMHSVLTAGLNFWRDWPDNAVGILDDVLLSKMQSRSRKWGVVSTYGTHYEKLKDLRPAHLRKKLLNQVADHAAKNGILRSRKSAFGVATKSRDFVSLREASKRLGWGYDRTRRAVVKLGVDLSNIKKGFPARIPTKLVKNLLLSQSDGLITATEMRLQLGTGKLQVKQLINLELLKSLPTENGEKFSANAASQLHLDLIGNNKKTAPKNPISLFDASKSHHVTLASICLKLKDGELKYLRTNAQSLKLSEIFVDQDELKRIYAKPSTETLSINAIAQDLEIKWAAASQLSQGEFLGEKTGNHHSTRHLQGFKLRFFKNSDLAKKMNKSPKSLIEFGRQLGIEPAVAPPKCRQTYFNAKDAEYLRLVSNGTW